ncbi:MAG: hypothetical protein WAV66_01905 [Anaerolineae bacterium]
MATPPPPPPPPPPDRKIKTGMHLGTRPSAQWSDPMLSRLQPPNGKWPAAVLVISSNLYEIERNGAGCSITGARVRNSTLFNYLRATANTGVKVIIRIHPSPGNFMDYAIVTPLSHRLLVDPTATPPGTSDLCHANGYRPIADLANEMHVIHDRNQQGGWNEFGFEPANEPNTGDGRWVYAVAFAHSNDGIPIHSSRSVTGAAH